MFTPSLLVGTPRRIGFFNHMVVGPFRNRSSSSTSSGSNFGVPFVLLNLYSSKFSRIGIGVVVGVAIGVVVGVVVGVAVAVAEVAVAVGLVVAVELAVAVGLAVGLAVGKGTDR